MGFCSKNPFMVLFLVIRGYLQGRKVIGKVEKKMAARYFKVKYDCSTNEARNKCNTALSCDFDWAIHCIIFMTQGHLQG